jgi:hypothetical protein
MDSQGYCSAGTGNMAPDEGNGGPAVQEANNFPEWSTPTRKVQPPFECAVEFGANLHLDWLA